MAEKLNSEIDLNNYLKTLNLNDVNVKKVLTSIQILHPKYLEQLVYLLVIQKLDITTLYNKEINNHSAPLIISEAMGSGTQTLVNFVEYYRDRTKSLPMYKSFMATKSTEAPRTLSRMLIPSEKFYVKYLLDELGFTQNSYVDNSALMHKYDLIVFSPVIQAKFAQITNIVQELKNSFGIVKMEEFNESLMEQIFTYRFLKPDNGSIDYDLNSDTLIGWIMREMYLDSIYENLVDNMNVVFTEMGTDYGVDIPKNGKYTIDRLLLDDKYSYAKIFENGFVDREKTFINELSAAINLRYTFYVKLYGITFYNQASINNAENVFEKIVEYFDTTQKMCVLIINELKTFLAGE